MNAQIINSIYRYMRAYSGSKIRIIENTCSDCNVKENAVISNINWLIENGYIKSTDNPSNMEAPELDYFRSDKCPILQKIKSFDEKEWYQQEEIRLDKEAKLTDIEKGKLYIERMIKKAEFDNPLSKITYKISYNNDVITINQSDNNIIIDLARTKKWLYIDTQNTIYYDYDGKSYQMDTNVIHNKLFINNHSPYQY